MPQTDEPGGLQSMGVTESDTTERPLLMPTQEKFKLRLATESV